jgi:hypothetical protein
MMSVGETSEIRWVICSVSETGMGKTRLFQWRVTVYQDSKWLWLPLPPSVLFWECITLFVPFYHVRSLFLFLFCNYFDKRKWINVSSSYFLSDMCSHHCSLYPSPTHTHIYNISYSASSIMQVIITLHAPHLEKQFLLEWL